MEWRTGDVVRVTVDDVAGTHDRVSTTYKNLAKDAKVGDRLLVDDGKVGLVVTALIVFITALGEVVIGTTAVLALFQTIGSLGEAKGLVAHAEALATTTLVLVLATFIMSSWLFAGAWLVQAALP